MHGKFPLGFLPAALVCVSAGCATHHQAAAVDPQACVNEANPDRRIDTCTRVIQSGLHSHADLARVLDSRGKAFLDKRFYDRAIRDFDDAIRLRPTDASAHFDRGLAYFYKGDYNRAMTDYDAAIVSDPTQAR